MRSNGKEASPHHEEELYIEDGRALELLSREGVDSPSLGTFQTHLDVFMCPLLQVPLLGQGGLD